MTPKEKRQALIDLCFTRDQWKNSDFSKFDLSKTLEYIRHTTDAATNLAVIVHCNQKDKSGYPYLRHIGRVAASSKNWMEKCVTRMHDCVEDSKGFVGLEALVDLRFPSPIISSVLDVSRNVSPHRAGKRQFDLAATAVLLTMLYPDLAKPPRANSHVGKDIDYMLGLSENWLSRATKMYDTRDNSDVSRWGCPSLEQLGKSHKYQSKLAFLSTVHDDEGGDIVKAGHFLAEMSKMGFRIGYSIVTDTEELTRYEFSIMDRRGWVRICSIHLMPEGCMVLSTCPEILVSEHVPDSVVNRHRTRALLNEAIVNVMEELETPGAISVSSEYAEEREYQRLMHTIF